MKHSILILGGTAEARQLAEALAGDQRFEVELSLAGRTRAPVAQPVPVRIGGFGGPEGLAAYMKQKKITIMIDATHPYAARISGNAAVAAKLAGVPLVALRRTPWERRRGDRWTEVESVIQAVQMLGERPQKVFLTLGRQELLPFEAAPQHHYLIRSVDPVEPPLDVPHAIYLTSRGPFAEADEARLLQEHAIEVIVAKNSGGPASYGKIAAARSLGIEVILIRRPDLPDVPSVETVEEMLAWLSHAPASPVPPLK
ncbi:cobalt-precorrin-6A reductase [Rhizobium sp. LC145]|uniref:cobalt-precorrin-6A reductase n=1 Tax=Rhizobium sp. LC145 TaxID=1120688 RepID=UPI00062A187D|nr:cobalt-precorrin-6A reductase [Rhizobium sp. LC145]KKX26684.1 cobalt-precorrin-6X reductase [Rhizobium sp. LC145]TKT55209.1 cobalt-precorrin-6A reductase [Rhizobiaceae bacterium LC148]